MFRMCMQKYMGKDREEWFFYDKDRFEVIVLPKK